MKILYLIHKVTSSHLVNKNLLMKEQILILQKKDKAALGAVRCIAGLQAAMQGDQIWVRGIDSSTKDLRIQQLPAFATCRLGENDLLFPNKKITPIGKLPELEWKSLQSFISVEPPVSAMPGEVQDSLPIRLVASKKEHNVEALLIDLATWKKYATTAPQVRLGNIQFAVSENDEVLICGKPLIPLPGKTFWLRGNILLPSGYDLELAVFAKMIQKRLDKEGASFILFRENGTWETIPFQDLIKGQRSAIRNL